MGHARQVDREEETVRRLAEAETVPGNAAGIYHTLWEVRSLWDIARQVGHVRQVDREEGIFRRLAEAEIARGNVVESDRNDEVETGRRAEVASDRNAEEESVRNAEVESGRNSVEAIGRSLSAGIYHTLWEEIAQSHALPAIGIVAFCLFPWAENVVRLPLRRRRVGTALQCDRTRRTRSRLDHLRVGWGNLWPSVRLYHN